MDPRPGTRVRARGLIWDVIEADRAGDRTLIGLRCAAGDLAGLEWRIFCPPETVAPAGAAIDPRAPGSPDLWRIMHQAHILSQTPRDGQLPRHPPGRIAIEPYQWVPLMRALDMPRPRLLLADGVGLGKTIQAGLIAAELIARRRAHRILIAAPPGPLIRQWDQEMRLRFGLKFTTLAAAADLWDVRRGHERGANPFGAVALCLTSLDFAKQDHVLADIERCFWDLVIVDEAHHCAATGEVTQRRRLAEVLARRSDGLLLLTATPHDGHDAHFASLIELLDPSLTDGAGGLAGQAYRRHVVRRLKSHVRDPRTGAPLFRRRHVTPVKVEVLGPGHDRVRAFHRALSAFVVPRLRAGRASGDALAFVSLLKRSVSTIAACLGTLRVVEERLARPAPRETKAARLERARALRAWRRDTARYGGLSAADEARREALGTEVLTESLRDNTSDTLTRLIALGMDALGADPKLAALADEIRLIRLARPGANILLFTEYADSQAAAAAMLRAAPGIDGEVLTIGGADDEDVRTQAAMRFSERDGAILISTDALAEGLNLHARCFHLIHLDLPYNPNRLEQRVGRIDRYGQQHEPDIRYLYLPGTFEERLLLHLIMKYEKARLALDTMPDTLGATADAGGTLTGELSEDPEDLFPPDAGTIRTLDRAAEETSPETVAALLREIDRAFDSFDLMAVSHGWLGPRADDAIPHRDIAAAPDGLADFVRSVLVLETGDPSRVPKTWLDGMADLPGIDPLRGTLCLTTDAGVFLGPDGQSVGFLGQAHPLVRRAIRHGCQLPGAVSAVRADRLGYLTTFELEISAAGHTAVRRVFAILAEPDRPPIEIDPFLFLALGLPVDEDGLWNRRFAPWAWPEAAMALAGDIATRDYRAFRAGHDTSAAREASRLHAWLRLRANRLCGPGASPIEDLFGAPPPGPAWRSERDPEARLVAFAADPETSASHRREANDVLCVLQTTRARNQRAPEVQWHRIGLLMLVPDHDD